MEPNETKGVQRHAGASTVSLWTLASWLARRIAQPYARNGGISQRVMCLSLHPHNIGRPNAAKYLDEALRYILGHDGVWNTTADDIAEYYIANYYDQVSSWIAERKVQP